MAIEETLSEGSIGIQFGTVIDYCAQFPIDECMRFRACECVSEIGLFMHPPIRLNISQWMNLIGIYRRVNLLAYSSCFMTVFSVTNKPTRTYTWADAIAHTTSSICRLFFFIAASLVCVATNMASKWFRVLKFSVPAICWRHYLAQNS